MAKKQTFTDKLDKKNQIKTNAIKLIRSFKSQRTGSIRFSEDMLHIPEGKTVENYLKEYIKSK